MSGLWLTNLVAYSAQLGALVGAALVTGWALRVRAPRTALLLWDSVLAASVVLPILLWATTSRADSASVARIVANDGWKLETSSTWSSLTEWIVPFVVTISMTRVAWLGIGLLRLRTIRRRSEPLVPLPSFAAALAQRLGVSAAIHLSGDVDGPVTLGVRSPLVLLPRSALELSIATQQAIVCHELLHVRRRDWLRNLLEQCWGALLWFHPAAHVSLLWFHPAAHVSLSRIRLMREAVVDEATIAITGDRRAYAHALLDFAERSPMTPLPVTPFISPRHLPRRIALITQEVRMSRRHSVLALASTLLVAATAAGATAQRLPLALPALSAVPLTPHAPAQKPVKPGDGVSLPRLIKQVNPKYTQAAMDQHIQGEVWLELVVQPSGEPTDIAVTKSLDKEYGLDDAAVEAATQWRFEPGKKDGKAVPVIVNIVLTFALKS